MSSEREYRINVRASHPKFKSPHTYKVTAFGPSAKVAAAEACRRLSKKFGSQWTFEFTGTCKWIRNQENFTKEESQ